MVSTGTAIQMKDVASEAKQPTDDMSTPQSQTSSPVIEQNIKLLNEIRKLFESKLAMFPTKPHNEVAIKEFHTKFLDQIMILFECKSDMTSKSTSHAFAAFIAGLKRIKSCDEFRAAMHDFNSPYIHKPDGRRICLKPSFRYRCYRNSVANAIRYREAKRLRRSHSAQRLKKEAKSQETLKDC